MPKNVRVLKEKRRARILPFLVKLSKKGVATASQIGCGPVEASRMESDGVIKCVDKVQSGNRGRPANIYRLTDAGRKRVKRVVAA